MARTRTEGSNGVADLSLLDNDVEIATKDIMLPEANVPQKVKDFVNRAHEYWTTNPEKWRRVTLGSADTAAQVKQLASAYARSTGRTFRTKKINDPTSLVYRVSDRFRKDNGDGKN